MINYRVQEIEAMVKKLKNIGVTIINEISTYPYGKFVHILDPEGNIIELWEPKEDIIDTLKVPIKKKHDEEVSSDLNKSILKAKVSGKSDFYTLNRCTNYLGKWIRYSGWYPDKKIRLWRKDKAKWVGAVHEVLTPKPKNAVQLSGDLLHHSYPSLRWHIEKINHYTDIAAKQMFENGKHVSSFKIVLSMNFEFFKKFLIQLGFLDGYHGFLLALMSAYYTLDKYAKLRNLHLKSKQSV